MSAGAWSRMRSRVEEFWNRHVRYRALYRHLDHKRAEVKARTAWMEELTEEELAEMLRGLNECIEAMQAADTSIPNRPEATA
ncbi:phage tail tape measure protein [Streptomyces sp. NBRC 110611]|uniref:hypothetical protein n=1 Tax=Streptomyces sp. NBRC 110611 TaxID=1621259 RepID=UPI0008562C7A|nr:hypothetical protein [Streptomyces sp. NBRC 110611]GAU68537.1 phage tail tape measure protein [Streptomyces sp. NBRC 110611]